MKNNYLLKILSKSIFVIALTIASITTFAQNNYTVTPIPHQVYQGSLPVQGTVDDSYSEPIPFGFDFDFFGNIYNEARVGTNGMITFTPYAESFVFCPFNFDDPIPSATFPIKNSFFGAYHDLNNNNAEGTITYDLIGATPYRKFIVLFTNHSLFQCQTAKSSFQMILYETLNILDVQIIQKQSCPTWNDGFTVTGIINEDGLIAFTPPGRNTGVWDAYQEGWRFARPIDPLMHSYVVCDTNGTGSAVFDLSIMSTEIDVDNPSSVTFHETLTDAETGSNPLPVSYTNLNPSQTIYAAAGAAIHNIVLTVIDCDSDYDLDTVLTDTEDLNNDGNLANDDTDEDGIPNFLDNDDDGDMVLTTVEYVFPNDISSTPSQLLDTDNDGIPNYLDNDDDGDGILTIDEDFNGNNDPTDDDVNENGIPDYLDNAALGLSTTELLSLITLYPNPASDVLYINNKSSQSITAVSVYSITGKLITSVHVASSAHPIDVSRLQSGIYLVKVETDSQMLHLKFVKK